MTPKERMMTASRCGRCNQGLWVENLWAMANALKRYGRY